MEVYQNFACLYLSKLQQINFRLNYYLTMSSLISQKLTNIDYFIEALELILPLFIKLIVLNYSKSKEVQGAGNLSDSLNLFDLWRALAFGLDFHQITKPLSSV